MDFFEWLIQLFEPEIHPQLTTVPSSKPSPPAPLPPPLTSEQLHRIMPHLSLVDVQKYIAPLDAALVEFQINTPVRVAALLGEIAEESNELRWWDELASGKEYEGRRDLGNTSPGDGVRYKGRGPIQLTGKNNYLRAGQHLDLDLVNHPELVDDPAVGFRTMGLYWQSHGL